MTKDKKPAASIHGLHGKLPPAELHQTVGKYIGELKEMLVLGIDEDGGIRIWCTTMRHPDLAYLSCALSKFAQQECFGGSV